MVTPDVFSSWAIPETAFEISCVFVFGAIPIINVQCFMFWSYSNNTCKYFMFWSYSSNKC